MQLASWFRVHPVTVTPDGRRLRRAARERAVEP